MLMLTKSLQKRRWLAQSTHQLCWPLVTA